MQVLDLLDSGRVGLYSAGSELPGAVETLMTFNPTDSPGFRSLEIGQGTWEVFYAPHIASLTGPINIRFEPIRYHLEGGILTSNVSPGLVLLLKTLFAP